MKLNQNTFKQKASPHDNLGFSLFVPRVSNSSTQRIQMLSQHIPQLMTLKNPEFPKVFTNFENMIGQGSITGYKKAEEDFTILSIIPKNQFNITYIIQYKYSKRYDILHYQAYDHIGAVSESYGTHVKLGDALKNAEVGTEVKSGSYLWYTPMYDEDNSFKYGTNLRACYTPYDGLNHEDAIVLTESAAEKLKFYTCQEIDIKVASNSVFLDLYNKNKDNNSYHSFPHIGEKTLGEILVAVRQKANSKLLFEFQQENMRKIDDTKDRVVYCNENAKVVDINIYTSKTPNELRATNDMFMNELADELEEQNKYWLALKEELDKVIPVGTVEQIKSTMSLAQQKLLDEEITGYKCAIDRPLPYELNENSYTNEFGYYWKLAHEYCNNKIRWTIDGSPVDSLVIKFTLLQEDKVTNGHKLTGR